MANRPLHAVIGLDTAHLTDLLAEAVQGTGPAVLPVPEATPAPALRTLLETLRPTAVRTVEGLTARADGVRVAEDTAVIVATSGSTGAPKGVELSATALLRSARASLDRIGAGPGDTWLCTLPTGHISGLQVLVRALVCGTTPLHRRFDVASVLNAGREHRPYVSLVPTQLRRLLAAEADLSVFPTILLGGAPPAPELLRAAREAGGRVVVTYGMSETCGGCVYDGVPLEGVTVELEADGRIRLAGPMLLRGYRLRPELTRQTVVTDATGRSWVRTNDLGAFDEQGALCVRGRMDDVINTGGHKVVASEVAAVLSQLESIAEVVVVGRPDPEWGERVTAVVVPAEPDAPPPLEQLRDWVRTRLPSYAAPHEIDVRTKLPMLAVDKPDLAALRRTDIKDTPSD
ncbi:AMP-binding protein [Salinactinospora qingdaonensis]|uniref:O-succinylbenzoate--CoA ligase n=1 Tax=Salinactinospora qingdaonensis TaxID=702744 RepID=A0ABP7F131_9ACTN